MSSGTTSRLAPSGLLITAVAAITVIILSATLQRAGTTQPWAMAGAMAAGLLVVFPAIRRWSSGRLRFYHWAATVAMTVAISVVLQVLLTRSRLF